MMDYLLSDRELEFIKNYSGSMRSRYEGDLLEKRKEEMIMLRFDHKWPLRRIGKRYGISRQRVCQIIGKTGKDNGGFNYGSSLPLQSLKNKSNYFADKTVPEIADEFNISYKMASRAMSGYRHKIDAAADAPIYIGHKWEEWAHELLISKRIKNTLMPIGHAFDILAFDKVRIDVKSANSSLTSPSQAEKLVSPAWTFHVRKNKRDNTDFYLCIIGPTEDIFVIPSLLVPKHLSTIRFCWPTTRPELSKWQHFHNAYDLIHEFDVKCA